MKILDRARFYRYDEKNGRFARHGCVVVDDGRIVALDERPVGIGASTIDLDGATVVAAFTDCHVHLAETGYYSGQRSLATVRTYAEFAEAVARIPRDAGTILYAGQYDDMRWDDRATADAVPLERAHGDVLAMLVRIDGHSSIVNRKTLSWLDLDPSFEGIERDDAGAPTGRLFTAANWEAQTRFLRAFPAEMLHAAEVRAVQLALENGVVHLHAQRMNEPPGGWRADVDRLRSLPAKIHPKICVADARVAQGLGLPYVGGDVFLDGSIGSRTAALCHAYADTEETGKLRFSDDELLAYFAGAEALGIAAGVHAIGDAAIEQCITVWERVLAGRPSPRRTRHFIEHFELARRDHIDACARMGLHLSMQPQFDATWADEGGMYDRRLGVARRRSMNALATIRRSGARLCGGSDSPVCLLNPLHGMQAAIAHHEPSQRLTAEEALAMYTADASYLGYAETASGNIVPGLAADFAVLDADPIDAASFERCTVLQTWKDGAPVSC